MTAFSAAEMSGHIESRGPVDTPLQLRTVECACGVTITADVRDPGPEVRRHNATAWHQGWWNRLEREAWDEE